MTPEARTQAAIDLLDAIIAAARDGGAAADVLIARYFAERRYAGSKDRRAVRALVYDAIRLIGERPETGRAAMVTLADHRPEIAGTFVGGRFGPEPIDPGEPRATPGSAPRWLSDALAASGLADAEQAALLERAPLDLRANTLKTTRDALLPELSGAEPVGALPDALRLPPDSRIEGHPALSDGRAEVQDAGSQIVAAAAGAAPGMTVVDLCAGGGGKTLALAAAMADRGRIIAADIDRARLQRLPPRAARAGVTIAETLLLDPGREADRLAGIAADVVLIDAPCSGTGTWRRNPEARWRLTPDRLARLVETQARLLDLAAGITRPGGTITYIVCSLLDAEGAGQVAGFLSRHPAWAAAPLALAAGRSHGAGVRLTPAHDATDGFFVARLQAPC